MTDEPDLELQPERRDPVVARALRDLPVPEHRLTFWADLDAAIAEAAAGGTGRAGGDGDRPGDGTGQLPLVRAAHQAPRRRRAAPWLAAAAGVLVVGIAAAAVLGGDDGGGEVADEATTTEAAPDTTASTLASTTAAPTSTSTTVAAIGEPADVARSFIDALGEGDTEAALALLGPRSLAYIESLGADPLGFVAEMQEGYGAWAGADDLAVTATSAGVVAPLEGELSVVTVQGTYPGEGEAERRVDAFPLVQEGEGWVVELVAFVDGRDNRLRFTLPPSDRSGTLGAMPPDGEVNVFVPAPGTVLFQIDGGELHADETADIPAGTFSLYAPPDPLAAGTHTLVAVAVGGDGSITPFGGTFLVEG